MFPQFDDLVSKNFGIFRNLGALTLSGYEELMAKNLENGEELLYRNYKKLKTGLAMASSANSSEELLNAMQSIVQNSIETANEEMRAALDFQRETNRVLERQAGEFQQLLLESLNGVVADTEKLKNGKRSVQKMAA